MTRTVVALVLAVVLVFGVLSLTGQRGSDARKRMVELIETNDFSDDEGEYLLALVDRFDAVVTKASLDPSDGEINTDAYVQLMLNRFMGAAREDGKSGEFIEKLGNLRASDAAGSAGG